MNTVQKNDTITKKQVQEPLENNQEKLKLSDKNRSSIKREIDKNAIEIWDINSTKSPYKNKGQENIKYYSSEKAQKNAEENKLKNRKKCKL